MAPTTRTLSPVAPAPQPSPLLERLEQLQDARRFRVEQLAELEQALGDSPRRDSVTHALHLAATTALAEIDAALDRMARGVYGLCVTCTGRIHEDRLTVLPMTAQCMPCHFNEQNLRFARVG